jgi:hypothetical protein
MMNDLAWFKSSYSGGAENCTEVAWDEETVYARDTKDRNGGTLAFDRRAWQSFVSSVTSRG